MSRWSSRSPLVLSAVAAVTVGFGVLAGCPSKKEEPVTNDPATNPPATPPPGGNSGGGAANTGGGGGGAIPAGPPGTIAGVVKFSGKAPEMKELPKPTDPVCAAAKPKDNSVIVNGGGLKDVLVRIAVGGARGDAPATAPVLKQEGCMYIPRVLGVVAGQDIEIQNADKTMHNVHTYKGQETLLNAGQPAGSSPIKKPASDEAAILKVKCDVHPWMTAYVIATDHPYFAVTDDNGNFKIDKVPSGDYTVEAWHSEFGLKSATLKVEASKSVDPKFEYKGDEKKPEL